MANTDIGGHMIWCRRNLSVFYFGLACTLVTGCANLPAPPTESLRTQWQRQVIAPARYAPQSNFRLFANTQKKSTAKGAATGSAMGLAVTGAFAAAGPLEAVIAPYLTVITVPVFAVSGAVVGNKSAAAESDIAALDKQIRRNLATLDLSTALAQAVTDEARQSAGRQLPVVDIGPTVPDAIPDYRQLNQQGIDSVLQVAVSKIGFTGGKQLRFYLIATVSVVRLKDNSRLYEREFVYQSEPYEANLWAKNEAALFGEELNRCYTSLAESIVEHVYLLTHLPLATRAKGDDRTTMVNLMGAREACGLAWISPVRDYQPSIKDTKQRNWNRFPKTANRHPVLSWEAFPRDIDKRTAGAALLAGIGNVRYDLRIWQVVTDAPPKLVYERYDLTTPSYVVAQSLQPGERYFWSARARFELNGTLHATEWGYFRTPYYLSSGGDEVKAELSPATVAGALLAGVAPRDPCTLDFIPIWNYYRFEIP